ncbi:MAG: hypothetical protein R3E89_11880 [Thiolinea sp.]
MISRLHKDVMAMRLERISPFSLYRTVLPHSLCKAKPRAVFGENPEQRLYPERADCRFQGAVMPFGPTGKAQQWIVVPEKACWDRRQYAEVSKQYWQQRFWMVERAASGKIRLLLEESGRSVSLRSTQTGDYHDFYLSGTYPATLPTNIVS